MIPPGLDAATFAKALAEFRTVVGAEWVFDTDEDVALYRDAFSPAWDEAEERVASAAVAPDSSEQVQAVMKIAHRYAIPIYPISTGKNLGYGGSAPNLSGSVVLDLKRLNRIIAVDDTRHFAIVEPGVSYFDLYRHIQDNKLDVWLDVPGPGWGSPIGNALDHGVGDTWGIYRNHFTCHSGMEVVLADGTLVRTGMGAMPGADTWAEYPYGYGPTVDGLFAQSNFGVVTKMGFWLMPAPEAYATGTVSVPHRRDIIPLIAFANRLEHQGLCGEPIYGSPAGREQSGPAFQALVKDGAFPSDEALDGFAQSIGKPSWSVKLQFYGPPEVVKAHWAAAQRIARDSLPGATFSDERVIPLPLSPQDRETVESLAFGIPSLSAFGLTARSAWNPEGADGHLFFSPIIPKSGEALLRFQQVMWEEFGKAGFPRQIGPYTVPNTWMFHSFACLAVFLISRSDHEGNAKIRTFFHRLIEVAAAHGWGEYRTAPLFQDAVRATYNFNGNALLKLQEQLKDAVDPKGILAAGRYGIWPAGRRTR